MINVNREDGHLLVAAIRVLAHRDQSPPDAEQVAELLGMPPESVRLKIAALIEDGILIRIESAWKEHLEIGDAPRLENLTPSEQEKGMEAELKDFDRRKQEEAERMDKLFSDGTLSAERERRLGEMDKGLFAEPPGKPANPFDDD